MDGTMVSANTHSLNYAENNGTCNHRWLTMLLGNTTKQKVQMKEIAKFSFIMSALVRTRF